MKRTATFTHCSDMCRWNMLMAGKDRRMKTSKRQLFKPLNFNMSYVQNVYIF